MKSIYSSKDRKFGKNGFYQSYEPVKIKGQRSTKLRYEKYKLEYFLSKDSTALDIGCNCGFFSIYLSQYILHVDAFDYDDDLVRVGKVLNEYLDNKNKTKLFVQNFGLFSTDKQYDFVNAAAIHRWVKMPRAKFCKKISSFVKPGGIILFEGHDVRKDTQYSNICGYFKQMGMAREHKGSTVDRYRRNFSLWRVQ